MRDHEPTVTSRILGAGLYAALKKLGVSASKIAELLGWSPSKVSRLLSGKRAGSPEDVAAFLALCGVVGPERARLLVLSRDWYQLGWWQDHGRRLQARFTALDMLDSTAVNITSYQPIAIPTILQTVDYTQALLEANPIVPADDIAGLVATHRRRQAIIDRFQGPAFRCLISEHVITHSGLEPDLMSEQVHHLLRLGVRPDVEIRIVPRTTVLPGDCPPFQLFTFRELRSVVCLENLTSTELLELPDSITAYRNVLTTLNQAALDEPCSRSWLRHLGAHLGRHDSPLAEVWTAETNLVGK